MALAVNPLLVGTQSPPIPDSAGWAGAYDGRHGPLVDLAQAVPGYPPAVELQLRIAQFAGSAESAAYGPILGDPPLREALARSMSVRRGALVTPGEIAITAGCNLAFVAAVMAVAGAGDAVLLPAPWYFNHKMTLDMLGIEARPLPTADTHFVPDVKRAAKLLDEKVRAIVLVTPNNPTGATYPAPTLAAFADLCAQRGMHLVVDSTYRDFVETDPLADAGLYSDPERRRVLVELYSFSKAYAVPGHRVGALAATPGFVAEVAKALDCLQICAPRTAQHALAWAIGGTTAWRQQKAQMMQERGAAFRKAMARVGGLKIRTLGGFFAYLEADAALGPSPDLARRLAADGGVVCLPGTFFGPGQERFLRVAYANVEADVLATLTPRFEQALAGV